MKPFVASCVGVLVLACALPAFAVDIPAARPDYLDRPIRPEWRLSELSEVLDDVLEIIERPISRSDGVGDWDDGIIFIEEEKITVLETLEVLEETQGLHFIAEPLRLVAMTREEFLRNQRRLVNFNLRDYGIFFQPLDHQLSIATYDESDDGASPFDYGAEEEDITFDLEALVGVLRSDGGLDDAELRGSGNLMVLATEQEEAALRSVLDRVYELVARRSSWRVHFGLVPRDVDAVGGIVDVAYARELAGQLDEHDVVQLSGMNGQLVLGGNRKERDIVMDVEVNQTGAFPVLNPVVQRVPLGRSVEIRPILGLEHTLLVFDALWSELDGVAAEDVVRRPPMVDPPRAWGSAELDKNGDKTSVRESVSISPARIEPGKQLNMERQRVWRWNPRGEVFVPKEKALVLVGAREGRRLAIILEEVK